MVPHTVRQYDSGSLSNRSVTLTLHRGSGGFQQLWRVDMAAVILKQETAETQRPHHKINSLFLFTGIPSMPSFKKMEGLQFFTQDCHLSERGERAIEWRPWSMCVTTGPMVMCEGCTQWQTGNKTRPWHFHPPAAHGGGGGGGPLHPP